MSSFLAGLVQGGAGLGAGFAVPAMPVHSSHASVAASFPMEAPPQTTDVSPVAPESRRQIPSAPPCTPVTGTALAPEPVLQLEKPNAIPAVQASESAKTSVLPLSPVEARAAPGIPVATHIVPGPGPSRAPETSRQPPIPADEPGEIPFEETPAIVIARPETQAPVADRAITPESPRIEVNARDVAAKREVSAATTSTSTQALEPPVTILTALRSVPGLESPLPPKPAPTPEPAPIHVRIGKVEVRAPAPPVRAQPPTRKPGAPAPRGFAAYRRLRTYR